MTWVQRLNKKILMMCLLAFILTNYGYAQNSAVQLVEMNLLYKGIDNHFRVAVDGVQKEQTVIKTSPGLKIKNDGLLSTIKVNKKYKRQEYIYVGRLAKEDTVWLDTFKYRIRSLPRPTAQFGEIVNDGLPKKRSDILEQKEIIATMGRGFAYDLEYEIKSYSMIIAYRDRPAKMMKANGGRITHQMRIALEATQIGDRIIIEGIRAKNVQYGFKANPSPIIIVVRDGKRNGLRQDRELIYIKINPTSDISDAIFRSDILDETLDTLQNEAVDMVYKDENGFNRQRIYYKNGSVASKEGYNDNGQLLYSLTENSNYRWKFQEFYADGSKKSVCEVDDSVEYIGNTNILECNNIVFGHYMGHGEWKWKGCDSVVLYSIDTDVHLVKFNYELNPIGYFRSYYPNGQQRYVGNLVLGFNGLDTLSKNTRLVYKEDLKYFHSKQEISVMDGIWHFYNLDGTLKHTRVYKKGVLLKD
jgi:hypothetical protein